MKTDPLKLHRYWPMSIVILSFLIPLAMFFCYRRPLLDYLLVIASILFCTIVFILHKKGSRSLFQIILIYLCFNGLLIKALDVLRDKTTSFNFYYDFEAFKRIKEIERESSPAKLFRVVTYGLPQGIAVYHGFQAADMEHNYYPTTYYNFWLKVLNDGNGIDPQEYQGLINGTTYHSVTLRMPKSDELGYRVKDLFFNRHLLALMNVKYLVSRVIIESPNRYHLEPLYEEGMESCRSFGYNVEGFRCRIKKYLQGPKASLYRLTDTVDRFFIVTRARVFDTTEALNESLGTSSLEALKTHLYMTREAQSMLDSTTPILSASSAAPAYLASRVESIDYTPDRIKLFAFANDPSYLIMTDTYSPRWECTDNGIRTPTAPAYETFRAIKLTPGSHEISCHFVSLLSTVATTIVQNTTRQNGED